MSSGLIDIAWKCYRRWCRHLEMCAPLGKTINIACWMLEQMSVITRDLYTLYLILQRNTHRSVIHNTNNGINHKKTHVLYEMVTLLLQKVISLYRTVLQE